MKILIAVPTFETIYPDTFQSIYHMDKCGHDCIFEFARGYDVATARNKIAQRAIDLKTDYCLMIDNDVVVPKDALKNLLEGNPDVCLGYYAHRGVNNVYNGNTCICRLKDKEGKSYYCFPLESEYTGAEMKELMESGKTRIPIHGGGMGCALIKTDVFRKIPYPWYDWVNYGDNNRGMLSEDLYFCTQCAIHQIGLIADTRVACGHMFRYVQWPEPIT